MKTATNVLFVLAMGVMMVATSALLTAGYPSIYAKKSSDSDSGSSGSGSSGSGNSDNSGDSSNDNSPHDDKDKDKLGGDTQPKQQQDDGLVHIPEQGWVDGKWTGGTEEMFNEGPNGDGIIPPGCSHGGCIPLSTINYRKNNLQH
jgi:hypothetical protein